MSCKTNAYHQTLYYNQITTGDFKLNGLIYGYSADIRGAKNICMTTSRDSTDTKVISEDEGEACISLLNEVLKKPCKQERAQNDG